MVLNLTDKDSYLANTYLFISDGEAILIDASASPEDVKKALAESNAKLKNIVLTHGHYDHVYYLEELRKLFPDAKVICGNMEDLVLTDVEANVSGLFGDPKTFSPCDISVVTDDEIVVGSSNFKVIQTPGHTVGSICLLNQEKKIMFTGDTLFVSGIGRTDFKYGSYESIKNSLATLATLDESIIFYPGHGDDGVLGWEF